MTRAELRAYILARLSLSSGDTARVTTINTLLDQEYLRLAGKHRLKKTVDDLAFTAGTATVTIPSDVMEILAIRKGNRVWMPVDEDRFADLEGNTYTSTDPALYYRVDLTTIRVTPTPTETTSTGAVIHYVQSPATLAAGGDSASPSAVPTQFHHLIAELVVAHVAMDEEEFQGHMTGALTAAARLEGELTGYMNRLEGTGHHRVVSARYG